LRLLGLLCAMSISAIMISVPRGGPLETPAASEDIMAEAFLACQCRSSRLSDDKCHL
jgi:hypothetical protein